jgi:hypothetical protein
MTSEKKENRKSIPTTFSLNDSEEMALFEYVKSQDMPAARYIKRLIRKDMEAKGKKVLFTEHTKESSDVNVKQGVPKPEPKEEPAKEEQHEQAVTRTPPAEEKKPEERPEPQPKKGSDDDKPKSNITSFI